MIYTIPLTNTILLELILENNVKVADF